MTSPDLTEADAYASLVKYFDALVNSQKLPELPPELTEDEAACKLHEQLLQLREIALSFARGDLSKEITVRGFIAGSLKALQANLRHLTWQVQQVEQADYTQRVEFLGDFSDAFNNMVVKLDETVNELRRREEELTRLNGSLHNEMALRNMALEALQESEARFKYLANHDSLTGALTRRSFVEQAADYLDKSAQQNSPCSFIMMDIDHFKLFNDEYGHLAGDAALQHIVKLSLNGLRNYDIMGRYGGEEFIFCLAYTPLFVARGVAERICRSIEQSPVLYKDNTYPITASLGVATALPQDYSAEEAFLLAAIDQADKMLYIAKQSGRNRVFAQGDELPESIVALPDNG